jgi:hypothetical protein
MATYHVVAIIETPDENEEENEIEQAILDLAAEHMWQIVSITVLKPRSPPSTRREDVDQQKEKTMPDMPDLKDPIDYGKVATVAEILKEGFPSLEVHDAYSGDRSAQYYRVGRGADLAHRIYVSKEFFDDHTLEEIERLLNQWRAVDTIRAAGARLVTIGNDGIQTAFT